MVFQTLNVRQNRVVALSEIEAYSNKPAPLIGTPPAIRAKVPAQIEAGSEEPFDSTLLLPDGIAWKPPQDSAQGVPQEQSNPINDDQEHL